MLKRLFNLYILACILGILVGFVGSVFQLTIDTLSRHMASWFEILNTYHIPKILSSMFLSMFMVWLAWFLVQRFAPVGAGSGIQEIKARLMHRAVLHWQSLLPVKWIGGVLSLSANMVLGREGPTIQMGGHLGAMLAQIFRLPETRRDTFIAAGAAAGLATAFNAPLAAVLFVFEELRDGFYFNWLNFNLLILTTVVATLVTEHLIGTQAIVVIPHFNLPTLSTLLYFVFLGLWLGGCGLLFNSSFMRMVAFFDIRCRQWKWLYVLIIGALIGLVSILYPTAVGSGYHLIEQAVTLYPTFIVLIGFTILRFFATLFCYVTGVPGGFLAPILTLGTLLGLLFHSVCHYFFDMSLPPSMFALAGMAGLFAAVIRAPLTGIVLVVEMTQNYVLIYPLMVTVLVAMTVMQAGRFPPVYDWLLSRMALVDKY